MVVFNAVFYICFFFIVLSLIKPLVLHFELFILLSCRGLFLADFVENTAGVTTATFYHLYLGLTLVRAKHWEYYEVNVKQYGYVLSILYSWFSPDNHTAWNLLIFVGRPVSYNWLNLRFFFSLCLSSPFVTSLRDIMKLNSSLRILVFIQCHLTIIYK